MLYCANQPPQRLGSDILNYIKLYTVMYKCIIKLFQFRKSEFGPMFNLIA